MLALLSRRRLARHGSGGRTPHPDIRAGWLAFAVVAIVSFGTAFHLYASYRQEIRHCQVLASSMAQALARHIGGSIGSIDGLLQEQAEAVQAGQWLTPAAHQHFSGRLKSYREVLWIGYVTPEGKLRRDTLPSIGIDESGLEVSDRAYFTALRDGTAAGLFVGTPVIGRATGARTIHMARAIRGADGRFQGLVLAAVNPDFYASILENALLDAEGGSTVVGQDGLVLARAPEHLRTFGASVANSAFFRQVMKSRATGTDGSSASGTAEMVSELDGIHKLVGYHVVEDYGLAVTSAVSMSHALAAWRHQVVNTVIALLGFAMVVALGALHADRLRAKRREQEAALKTALAKAEQADLAKTRFLAAASHDLRQPFQAMALYRDVLGQQLSEPGQRKVLNALSTAMAAGERLLDALLHVSALEAGVTTPSIVPVPLADLLDAFDAEFRPQALSQGLGWRCVRCSAVVATDPVLFGRMIRNLVVNALKYTKSGCILLGCRRVGQAIRIEVWDTGPGVPFDKQEMIWEEFTQLENAERDRAKGLGLGLAIVARTARLLDHPATLRSKPGAGSVFSVTVPLAPPALQEGAVCGHVAA